jgi:hypothetical protein
MLAAVSGVNIIDVDTVDKLPAGRFVLTSRVLRFLLLVAASLPPLRFSNFSCIIALPILEVMMIMVF